MSLLTYEGSEHYFNTDLNQRPIGVPPNFVAVVVNGTAHKGARGMGNEKKARKANNSSNMIMMLKPCGHQQTKLAKFILILPRLTHFISSITINQ